MMCLAVIALDDHDAAEAGGMSLPSDALDSKMAPSMYINIDI
jgi:hypothetical protein